MVSTNEGVLGTMNFQFSPAASAAGTTQGTGVDRITAGGNSGYLSAKVFARTGAVTGAPSAQSVTYTVQHRAAGGAWSNLLNRAGQAQTLTITAADTTLELDIDLKGANQEIRLERVVSFTGGTSPTFFNTAGFVLMGKIHI